MEGLLERLQCLPGFDNERVLLAMCCADNDRFLVWENPFPKLLGTIWAQTENARS